MNLFIPQQKKTNFNKTYLEKTDGTINKTQKSFKHL